MSQDTDDRKALILEQKYKLLAFIHERNQSLDDRADRIVQIGGIMVGLTAVANIPFNWASLAEGFRQALPTVFIGLSLLVFLGSLLYSLRNYLGITFQMAGTADWDDTRLSYLESEDYYLQLLSDVVESVQSASAANDKKATGVKVLSVLLAAQIILFGAAWLSSL